MAHFDISDLLYPDTTALTVRAPLAMPTEEEIEAALGAIESCDPSFRIPLIPHTPPECEGARAMVTAGAYVLLQLSLARPLVPLAATPALDTPVPAPPLPDLPKPVCLRRDAFSAAIRAFEEAIRASQ